MKRNLLKNWPLVILVVLAFFTRFWNLSWPAEVVFDEVHFGKFVSAYFSHQYYFDIHPPLGKLMIAGFAKLCGLRVDSDFNSIGTAFDPYSLFILRFLPAFFGAIFVLLIYQTILALGVSPKGAFFGAFLVLFDNAFLVESKFILIDLFLLCFGFTAFYFFILSRKASGKKQIFLIVLSAIFSGLSFSIKWTGLTFLAVILLSLFINFLKHFKIKLFFLKSLIFLIIPLLVYISFFAIHFRLLYKSGPGDAFMTPAFQKELQGNKITEATKPLSFLEKFIELNKRMYSASATLTATHPDGSSWREWPIMRKPVWYWTKSSPSSKPEGVMNIYLIGNPLVWLMVILAIITSISGLVINYPFNTKEINGVIPLFSLLVFGYFVNLLPFVFIGRVTFLYHYLPALSFGVLISSILVDRLVNPLKEAEEKPYRIKKLLEKGKLQLKQNFFDFRSLNYFALYSTLLTLVFLVFLFFAPLSYGLPVKAGINHIYQSLIQFLH